MRKKSWIFFYDVDEYRDTRVHILPASLNIATPYPVNISLSFFGESIDRKNVAIEGGRLFQPDGIKLSEIELELREGADRKGMIGVKLELSCSQPRGDISLSSCLVEVFSEDGIVRYIPSVADPNSLEKEEGDVRKAGGILMRDSMVSANIVVINATENNLEPNIMQSYREDVTQPFEKLPLGLVSPMSAAWRRIDSTLFSELPAQEMEWGLLRSMAIIVGQTDNVAYYVVYLDAVTGRLLSVAAF